MTSITEICACPRCKCEVDHQAPGTVKKRDQYYCSKQCAGGHKDYPGCGHTGCACYSLPSDEWGKPSAKRTDSQGSFIHR